MIIDWILRVTRYVDFPLWSGVGRLRCVMFFPCHVFFSLNNDVVVESWSRCDHLRLDRSPVTLPVAWFTVSRTGTESVGSLHLLSFVSYVVFLCSLVGFFCVYSIP
mgnify:CR=1 FL=1